jgi:hypothetical protein
MGRETETKNKTQAPEIGLSRVIILNPDNAKTFVQRILKETEPNNKIVLVLDGAKIKPQENFSKIAWDYKDKKDRFSIDYRKYLADKAVNAGLFVSILDKSIEESKRLASALRKPYDPSWEEKISRMTSRYRWTETDKVTSACVALEYTQKTSNTLGLMNPLLIIFNFDKLDHPTYGNRFNPDIAKHLIEFGYGTDVLLFATSKKHLFRR